MRIITAFYMALLLLFVETIKVLDLCGLAACVYIGIHQSYAPSAFLDHLPAFVTLVIGVMLVTMWEKAQREKVRFVDYAWRSLKNSLSVKHMLSTCLLLPLFFLVMQAATDSPQNTAAMTAIVAVPFILLLLGFPAFLRYAFDMKAASACFLLVVLASAAGIVLLGKTAKSAAEMTLLAFILSGIASTPFVVREALTAGRTGDEAAATWAKWRTKVTMIAILILALLAIGALVTPFLLMPRGD